jgi:hypothetical protein
LYYYGKSVVQEQPIYCWQNTKILKAIPLKMAPLVLVGTLVHIFLLEDLQDVKSTAVQMGGTIADQFTTIFQT